MYRQLRSLTLSAMSKRRRGQPKDHASLDKYGASITTAFAVGATVWALFRVGFRVKDGVEKLSSGKQSKRKNKV